VMPTLVLTAPDIHSTSPLVILVLAMVILALRSAENGSASWWSVVGLGAVIGVGSLVKPVFVPVPILVLWSWLVLGGVRKAAWKFVVVILVAACFVTPWTVRNYLVLGAFVPVSTNSGGVLYQGMNPESNGMWSPAMEDAMRRDEVQASRMACQAALDRMRTRPLDCALLMVRKQAFMWGTSSTNMALYLSPAIPDGVAGPLTAGMKFLANAGWSALWVLCLAGTLTTSIWKEPRFALGVLFLGYVFTSHLVLEVQSRYHIPVICILILVAAAGLALPSLRPAAMPAGTKAQPASAK
jgi:hypothetical protein